MKRRAFAVAFLVLGLGACHADSILGDSTGAPTTPGHAVQTDRSGGARDEGEPKSKGPGKISKE